MWRRPTPGHAIPAQEWLGRLDAVAGVLPELGELAARERSGLGQYLRGEHRLAQVMQDAPEGYLGERPLSAQW